MCEAGCCFDAPPQKYQERRAASAEREPTGRDPVHHATKRDTREASENHSLLKETTTNRRGKLKT